jgi:succinate dehydrogenase / fumarate reductase, membrane anchor subunit
MASDQDSRRTSLGRVRYLGAARFGVEESWGMRVSSIALIPLTIAFVWLLLALLSKDYNGVREALGRPLPAIIVLLYVLVGVYHMQLGMRSIILDYLHDHAKEWALIVNLFFCGALALACVYSVLRIGFV